MSQIVLSKREYEVVSGLVQGKTMKGQHSAICAVALCIRLVWLSSIITYAALIVKYGFVLIGLRWYNMNMDWTTRELAEKANVSINYVQAEIRQARLKATRRARMWFIADVDAQAWLSNPRRGSRSKSLKRGGDADSTTGDSE